MRTREKSAEGVVVERKRAGGREREALEQSNRRDSPRRRPELTLRKESLAVRMSRLADDPAERGALAEGAGRNPAEYAKGVEVHPWVKEHSDPQREPLLEKVVEPGNNSSLTRWIMMCSWPAWVERSRTSGSSD